MEGYSHESEINTIRYENEGLPKSEDLSVPWLLEKLDPSAIASRALVKSFHIDNDELVRNIQDHEASRGRHFARIYEEMLNKHEETLKDSKILELGAGPGALCLALEELGADVVSLDVKDGRIFYSKEVPFLKAEGTMLPFADKSFKYVSLTSVLHHISAEKRDPVLNEAFRIADKVLIQEDCLTSPLTNVAMRIVDDSVSGEIGTHQANSHLSKAEWLEYFKNHDIKVLETYDFHPKWIGVGIQKAFFVISKDIPELGE